MDKHNLQERQQNILDLVREFCAKKLDEEYFELSERLVQKLGRKRNPPFATGHHKYGLLQLYTHLGQSIFYLTSHLNRIFPLRT